MIDLQKIDLKKEIEKIKREDPGKIRGAFIKSYYNYIVQMEGEAGWRKLAAELERAEFSFPDIGKIGNMEWVPSSLSTIFLLAAGKVFRWQRENFIDFGKDYINLPFSSKIFIKYFISLKKTFELAARNWKRQYTFGEIELKECDSRKKRVVAIKKDDKRHPVVCLLHLGAFSRIVEIATGKKVTAEETKCMFHGDPYHEYVFRW